MKGTIAIHWDREWAGVGVVRGKEGSWRICIGFIAVSFWPIGKGKNNG
jgi:hypothetical protein